MAERPSKDASRSDWDDYAKTLDLNPEDYQNKEALIEAVEAELLLRDDEKKGKYPEGREGASKSWKKAYDHAVAHGNPEKTATLYADQHFQDEEFGG